MVPSKAESKVAVITGSSNGIGRATAILLAREGAKVTITGRNEKRLEDTRQQIIANGVDEHNINAVVTDLNSSNEVRKNRYSDLNIRSVVELTQKAKPYLEKVRGEIVNVSSIGSGPQSQPDNSYYCMAKAALDQFTRNIALELIASGIRVNSVNPGLMSTGFVEAMGSTRNEDLLK